MEDLVYTKRCLVHGWLFGVNISSFWEHPQVSVGFLLFILLHEIIYTTVLNN